jgi:hypothetical protein
MTNHDSWRTIFARSWINGVYLGVNIPNDKDLGQENSNLNKWTIYLGLDLPDCNIEEEDSDYTSFFKKQIESYCFLNEKFPPKKTGSFTRRKAMIS